MRLVCVPRGGGLYVIITVYRVDSMRTTDIDSRNGFIDALLQWIVIRDALRVSKEQRTFIQVKEDQKSNSIVE